MDDDDADPHQANRPGWPPLLMADRVAPAPLARCHREGRRAVRAILPVGCMTRLVYRTADTTFAESLVEQFTRDWSASADDASAMKSLTPYRVCLPKRVG
jgi:hypothetical protein